MSPLPPIHAFFHCWVDGTWGAPLHDFLSMAEQGGLDDQLAGKHVGLVGHPDSRAEVAQLMPHWEVAAAADTGFTQVTLTALRDFALAGNEGYVLYAHNKGAMNDTELNRAWRRSMFRHCVLEWRKCAKLLSDHDAVGCHWLTHEMFPNMITPGRRFFGGEVWWARLDYLRTLPPLETETRWHSEHWIAENPAMRHYDLLPGWPAMNLF